MNPAPSAIEVRGLVVRYPGSDRAIVDGFDLVVPSGVALGITGRSGSGKSTLLMHLAGLRRPEAGVITILGRSLGGLSQSALAALRAERVGFVFQRAQLVPYLSARSNIELPLRLSGRAVAAEWPRLVQFAAGLGICEVLDRRADRLSVGEAQRVALVRALASDPDLLFADEPTGALDQGNASILAGALLDWQRGASKRRTLVVATHDLGLAELLDLRLAIGA